MLERIKAMIKKFKERELIINSNYFVNGFLNFFLNIELFHNILEKIIPLIQIFRCINLFYFEVLENKIKYIKQW